MFLGVYEFGGDPAELLETYERLMALMPAGNITWHLCAVQRNGIAIYDTCPSREVFEAFSTGEGFRNALQAAGLPSPVVHGYPVHAARGEG